MISSRSTINIMIIDLDACVLIPTINMQPNPRSDILSRRLIKYAFLFDAFYICTHRTSIMTFDFTLAPDRLKAYSEALQKDFDPANMFTTKIKSNFAEATKLECLAVSTPDDDVFNDQIAEHQQCGYSFNRLLEKYELKLLEINKQKLAAKDRAGYSDLPSSEKSALTGQQSIDGKSKNKQLIQIVKHAQNLPDFQGKKLKFTFYDDIENICKNALKISLPGNALLHVINHCDYNGKSSYMGTVVGAEYKKSTPVHAINPLPAQRIEPDASKTQSSSFASIFSMWVARDQTDIKRKRDEHYHQIRRGYA